MSDPVRQLVEQHNQLRRLFKQVPRLETHQSAADRAYAICDLVTVHSRLEEEIVYPFARAINPAMADEADAAHARAKALVDRFNELDYMTNHVVKHYMARLEGIVMTHARWEEDHLLPLVSALANEQFDWIGRAVYERHQELLREYSDSLETKSDTEGYSGGPLL
ncbi:MAG: hemerythrin domain-containing protein [Actinomycetota bacterium]|nr:hemerythrin domain-containing protein [Actinomycetota bacterium]